MVELFLSVRANESKAAAKMILLFGPLNRFAKLDAARQWRVATVQEARPARHLSMASASRKFIILSVAVKNGKDFFRTE